MADVFTLFDDFAARFARGERPDARAYFERAGESGDELAQLIDGYLARAVAPAPDDDVKATAAAWLAGDSPLLALRVRRGVRRDAIVDALIERLGLDPQKRPKVKRYYHELESGLLDPRGVHRTVWDAIAAHLRGRVDELLSWRPPEPATTSVFMRVDSSEAAMYLPSKPLPGREDEIDRLFLRGRE